MSKFSVAEENNLQYAIEQDNVNQLSKLNFTDAICMSYNTRSFFDGPVLFSIKQCSIKCLEYLITKVPYWSTQMYKRAVLLNTSQYVTNSAIFKCVLMNTIVSPLLYTELMENIWMNYECSLLAGKRVLFILHSHTNKQISFEGTVYGKALSAFSWELEIEKRKRIESAALVMSSDVLHKDELKIVANFVMNKGS